MSVSIKDQNQTVPYRVEVVDADMAAVFANKSEAERLHIGWGMWRSARSMINRLLRSEHPDWSTEQIDTEVARRLASGT